MKKLSSIFEEKPKTFSFELFPPKTEKGYQNLLKTIEELVALKPDFISCTYEAGGGNREKTLDIVELLEKKHKTTSVAHLTCVLNTRDQIKSILKDIKKRGVSNLLALRGDPPMDAPEWKPQENNFAHSANLTTFIKQNFGNAFCVGVAGFPEGHPESPSREKDREFLKAKVDSGAEFVLTQLFFGNKDYFEYVLELKKLGIHTRIIPGILPITNYNNLLKFCQMCKATVPQNIKDIFAPLADDPDKTLQAGVAFAVKQCKELLEGGAPGLHFYSLNKVHPVSEILKQVRS